MVIPWVPWGFLRGYPVLEVRITCSRAVGAASSGVRRSSRRISAHRRPRAGRKRVQKVVATALALENMPSSIRHQAPSASWDVM